MLHLCVCHCKENANLPPNPASALSLFSPSLCFSLYARVTIHYFHKVMMPQQPSHCELSLSIRHDGDSVSAQTRPTAKTRSSARLTKIENTSSRSQKCDNRSSHGAGRKDWENNVNKPRQRTALLGPVFAISCRTLLTDPPLTS